MLMQISLNTLSNLHHPLTLTCEILVAVCLILDLLYFKPYHRVSPISLSHTVHALDWIFLPLILSGIHIPQAKTISLTGRFICISIKYAGEVLFSAREKEEGLNKIDCDGLSCHESDQIKDKGNIEKSSVDTILAELEQVKRSTYHFGKNVQTQNNFKTPPVAEVKSTSSSPYMENIQPKAFNPYLADNKFVSFQNHGENPYIMNADSQVSKKNQEQQRNSSPQMPLVFVEMDPIALAASQKNPYSLDSPEVPDERPAHKPQGQVIMFSPMQEQVPHQRKTLMDAIMNAKNTVAKTITQKYQKYIKPKTESDQQTSVLSALNQIPDSPMHLGQPTGAQLDLSQFGVSKRPNKQKEDAISKFKLTFRIICQNCDNES